MKVIPYTRFDGIPTLRDSEIAYLFELMQRDGYSKTVFYAGEVQSASDFVVFAKSVVLFAAYQDNAPVAVGWLNGIESDMARCHFCFFAECADKVATGKLMIEKALATTGLNMLVGYVPESNKAAIGFAVKCGAELLGYLPFGSYGKTAVLYYVRYQNG